MGCAAAPVPTLKIGDTAIGIVVTGTGLKVALMATAGFITTCTKQKTSRC